VTATATSSRIATLPDTAGSARPRAEAPALTAAPWRALERDVAAWDALSDRASEPNPFFESWYLLPALRAFDPRGQAQVLRFEHQGRLAGLLPIKAQPRYYGRPIPNLSAWMHANCFLGAPLVERGCEAAFWQALLAWADSHAGKSLFLHLPHIPLEGPLYAALREVLASQQRGAALVLREERAMLASRLSAEAYFEGALSGKKRKELRRQMNRLRDEGEVACHRETGDAGLDTWIESFLLLERSGWKGSTGSALACSPDTEALFRDSLHGAAARGRLERLSLTLNDRPIAMLATFLTPPGAFSFKTAFDEDYARFSPGVLLQRENLAMLERGDVAWSDSCAAADHPMIDHIWRERRAIGRVSIAIGAPLRRALFHFLARLETGRPPAGL